MKQTRRWTTSAVLLLLVVFAVAICFAEEPRVEVAVNGGDLAGGALIIDERAFVNIEDVAHHLGGRFLIDEQLDIAFVVTGNYLNLIADTLVERNPDLQGYHPIAGFSRGRGVQYGMTAPHLSVAFIPAGIAVGFVQAYVDWDQPYLPWFDQEPGRPDSFFSGEGYSQHLYVVDPGLIVPHETTQVAFNGTWLQLDAEDVVWNDGSLYVGLRALAEASGGGVGWDAKDRRATAKIVPGPELTWESLTAFNPKLSDHYSGSEEYDPGIGYRYATQDIGLMVGVGEDRRVTAIGAAFPVSSTPWFPWYDQMQGFTGEFPGVGAGYSQHIYFGDASRSD